MSDTALKLVHPQPAPSESAQPTGIAGWLGVLLTALATLSIVVCLAGFATRHAGLGVGGACFALLASGAALASLSAESRRIRDAERMAR
jgi:hypothetical protein